MMSPTSSLSPIRTLEKLTRALGRALALPHCGVRAALPLALAFTVACPQDPPPVIGEGEGEGEGEGGEGEGEGSECLTATLGPVVFNFQDDVSTHYEAELTSELDGVNPDFLVLQFFNYNERIGDLGVGTFPLDDETNDNYGHCAECLMVFADQLNENATPTRVFFQSEGSITLERNPREGIDLIGAIEGLVLVESTIGGDALESAPVPGGDCLVIGDVDLNVKFVPEGWTCDPALFNAKDGVCDCDCGVIDTDCFPNFDDPPPTSTVGCEEDEVCTIQGCLPSCDLSAGEGCLDPNDVCAFSDPVDVCQDAAVVGDPAALGEACNANDFQRQWCAIDATVPGGACDFDIDGDGQRLCRALCAADADCAEGEICHSLAGFGTEQARGFCDQPFE